MADGQVSINLTLGLFMADGQVSINLTLGLFMAGINLTLGLFMASLFFFCINLSYNARIIV
jgi:hypothetical protein